MVSESTSRRSFVVGAGASVALAGTVAFLAGRERVPVGSAASEGIVVVPGGTPGQTTTAMPPAPTAAMIGQPVRLTAEAGDATGSILSVTPEARPSRRPPGVRAQPFIVHLAMDPVGAPAGDRIYALATPIAGLREVFLTRGADMGGKAILMAVFN